MLNFILPTLSRWIRQVQVRINRTDQPDQSPARIWSPLSCPWISGPQSYLTFARRFVFGNPWRGHQLRRWGGRGQLQRRGRRLGAFWSGHLWFATPLHGDAEGRARPQLRSSRSTSVPSRNHQLPEVLSSQMCFAKQATSDHCYKVNLFSVESRLSFILTRFRKI